MGRTQELRDKILRQQAARRPDPELVRFTERVNDAIEDKRAFVYFSNPWVERLFAVARDVPEETWHGWIADKTKDLFLSAKDKPSWPGGELGDWCFHDDEPLTFVGQMPAEEPGRQLFVFTGTRHVESEDKTKVGLRAFYKMLIFDRDGSQPLVYGMISY